jgi:anaerobic selenocysteine-containing dehydrogenase
LQQKVIEPIGESRSVFDVEYDLATRLGLEEHYPWTTNEEWINFKLKPLNVTFEELQRQFLIYVNPGIEYNKYRAQGFKTRSGKIELDSQTLTDIKQDSMPVYRPFEESPDLIKRYPLVGTTRRPGNYVHTRFRDVASLRKMQPDPLVRMHPQDAERRKIVDGDLVSVESAEGKISVKVMVTDEIRQGFVIVDFGWGNSWDGGPNVNILTSDQVRCPLSGATPNRRFRCEITRTAIV